MLMKAARRLIVALDGMTVDVAEATIKLLAPLGVVFKVGLEQISAQVAKQLVELAQLLGAQVFWDGKLHDIPTTVGNAVVATCAYPGVSILNVHCLGGEEMMQKAVEARGLNNDPLIVGVTILTSHNYSSALRLGLVKGRIRPVPDGRGGMRPVSEQEAIAMKVVQLASMAQKCGLDGVIASPLELAPIREACGEDFRVITPGVRPTWAATDDQRRVMTPGEAIEAGAYALVVGRPITQPPTKIGNSEDAAKLIIEEIAAAAV